MRWGITMTENFGDNHYKGYANDYSFIDEIKNNVSNVDIETTKVSVVIPYFERSDKLVRTLNGLQGQSFPIKNIELLICDDGSVGDISSILESYQTFFFDIKYFRNAKNGFGLSKVRNIGIINATFDVIIMLDDDMIPCETLVWNHVSIVKTNVKVISVGFRHHKKTLDIDETDLSRKYSLDQLDWRLKNTTIEEVFNKCKYDTYFSWSFVSGGNLAFDKSIMGDVILFNEKFESWGGEDNEWAYRLYKRGYYFFPNIDAIAIHQDDDDQSKKTLNNPSSVFSLVPPIMDFYKQNDYSSCDIPLVSFWMCNNNRALYIQEAIKSILHFPYRFEIVVVDDGSTDDSVMKIISLNISNLTLIKIPKNTLGYAYKTALDNCRGEYLVQLDSDDYISNMDGLVNLVILAMNSPYGLVYGHHFHVDEQGKYLSPGWKHPICDRRKMLFNAMHVHPPRVIKKRDYSRARPIDTSLDSAVDYDLYSKILEISEGYFYDVDMYAYRQHELSVSKNRLDSQKNNVSKIIKDRLIYYGIYDKCFFDDTIKRDCIVTSHSFDVMEKINNKVK